MKSKLLRTNILAIRCMQDLVLVGMGPTLYIFDRDTCQLKSEMCCLYPNNIHGIVLGPHNTLAVFGSNTVCVCEITKENQTLVFKKQSIRRFNNWIISVKWILVKRQMQLAILLAHNYVSIYNIINQSSQVICCKEKCILYGGSMSGSSLKDLVIFSGTVFQEILIWKVNDNCSTNEGKPVLHRLTGHKGVIFSVIYDPHSRLICSTSDDRTVRLWKVTGDGNSKRDNGVNWQMCTVTLTKTMFAHTARVWRAMIKSDTVMTIGEDSLMCTWSLSGDLLDKVYAHHGAPIWSIDMPEDGKSIFTGGADGSVYVWPSMCCDSSKLFLPNNNPCDIPKYIFYLSSGIILIFDEKGTLYSHDRQKALPIDPLYLKKYRNYCIMQISPCRSLIALASREGYVTIYKEIIDTNTRHLRRLVEERVMESQIFSLHWLRKDALVTCGANGLLRVFNFTINGVIHVEAQHTLPPSRERWLVSAVMYEELLVCGDRAGNVHVYDMNDTSENSEKPIQTLTRVHGKIGVQSFAVLDNKLMSTGRDGILRFYESSKEGRRFLRMLHGKKMPMDWISGILKVDGTILILGFKEVEFIVYDLQQERILIKIPCGGGHRSWDCVVSDGAISFAYIRNKRVYVLDYPLKYIKLPILQHGFHVKETCCLRRISRLGERDILVSAGEDCTLRVSYISEASLDGFYIFRNLGVFDGHLSGVKCISAIKLNSKIDELSRHLVFSGGGRAQLKVWEMNLKYDKRALSNVNLSCFDVKSHMLCKQDQYGRKLWQEAKQSYTIEPETRYMDIHTYYPSDDLNHVLIFVACADGYLRLLVYDIKTSDVYLKISTRCVDRCILKMHVLSHERKTIVLTMTTDGVLRFFDFTNIVSKIYADANSGNQDILNFSNAPIVEFSLHQSGINSFDLKSAEKNGEKNGYFLITGGDDNLLNFLRFKILENKEILSVTILSKWSTTSTHSAQIIGLRFKNDSQICSVGIDQRVIVYNYTWSDKTLYAEVLHQMYTSITDIQGIDLWPSNNTGDLLCIYGRGFEVLCI